MGNFFCLLAGLLFCSQAAFAEEINMSAKAIEQQIKPIGQVQIGAPAKPLATVPPSAPSVTSVPATSATTPGAAPTAPAVAPMPTTATPSATTAPAGTPVPQGTTTQAANEGEKVYKTYCFACHATGAAGAPKFGDVAAWAPRIQEGMPTLVSRALNGYKLMPPKGTCVNCTNDQIAAAVKYMVSNSQKK